MSLNQPQRAQCYEMDAATRRQCDTSPVDAEQCSDEESVSLCYSFPFEDQCLEGGMLCPCYLCPSAMA